MTLATHTPQQAAKIAGVSRGTIMNAIKGRHLDAFRGNRNHWMIHDDELTFWMQKRAAIVSDNSDSPDTPAKHVIDEKSMRIAVLEAEAQAKDKRISDLESDRDSWREQAQQLANMKTRRWWPF